MEFTGKIQSVNRDWKTGQYNIIFTVNEEESINQVEKLHRCEKIVVKAEKFREKRSVDANAYMWSLLQKMADVLDTDKWSLYIRMLGSYGVFTHIIVKPNVVDKVKKKWRTVTELGEVNVHGRKGIQLQCYFGSSSYNTKEMATLLDGVIREAKELNIDTLPTEKITKMKEDWNREK